MTKEEPSDMVLSRTRTQTRFVVLPPSSRTAISSQFRNVEVDARRHDDLFAEMQRFRGGVYLNDGAIQSEDLTDGRHMVGIDERSWHVLSVDSRGRICACLRYLEERHASGFEDLWVRHSALSQCPRFGNPFRRAVETEMERARQMQIGFGEVGGWAVAESHRWTMEPLRIILATYGLLQLRGGCAGVATATFRHSSATILRRIGLNSLSWDGAALPPYYDPNYRCEMEVLHFDSRFPNQKYRDSVTELSHALATSPVICREGHKSALPGVFHGFDIPVGAPGLVPVAI
jgi:hypothetical protein